MTKKTHTHRRTSGFTLIELLVVIAIIALLVSILLPSLQAARNQAKLAKCRANMYSSGKGFNMYFSEEEHFPILLLRQGNRIGWNTWTFGGWGGRNRDYWQGYTGGLFYVPTERRPLSVYMLKPGDIPPENKGADGIWNTGDDQTTEMPMFECPSDFGTAQGEEWNNYLKHQAGGITAYDDIGTSYDLNMVWWYQATGPFAERLEKGNRLWVNATNRNASRFVTLYEDPADRGFHDRNGIGTQTMGFHKRFSRHVASFMDGHAEYVEMDTRKFQDNDWTTVDEWWLRPDGYSYNCRYADHLARGIAPHKPRG